MLINNFFLIFFKFQLLLKRDDNFKNLPAWFLKTLLKTGYLQKAQENNNVRKRVFCNGFFGCGNGKHRKRASPPIQEEKLANRLYEAEESLKNKRLFCNSWGCNNGKRSLMDTLMESLNKNSDSADTLREQEVGPFYHFMYHFNS